MHLTTSYQILDLDPEADEAQAKRAYKAHVRRWHPDQFPEGSTLKAGAEERLKQINIAYAHVREHLANHRPQARAATAVHPAPQPEQPTADRNDTTGQPPKSRSWVDYLFDTLNAFAKGRNAKPSPASTTEASRIRPKRFDQILNEMAGGHIFESASRPTANPNMAQQRHAASGYRLYRRNGANVGAVGGTERPGPVKPVGRVRGIGRNR